jgi:hypothetical protein
MYVVKRKLGRAWRFLSSGSSDFLYLFEAYRAKCSSGGADGNMFLFLFLKKMNSYPSTTNQIGQHEKQSKTQPIQFNVSKNTEVQPRGLAPKERTV